MTTTLPAPTPERLAYAAYESLRERRDAVFAVYRLSLAPSAAAIYRTLAEATADACRVWLATRTERNLQ